MMSNELTVGYRTVGGLRIRYADSDGSASQHLVLTTPWPESSPAFDPVWKRLSGVARLLAIDVPGSGPAPRLTELLSPAALSAFLIQIIDEWDLHDPHLICPDVGTLAALFAAARHPERIRSLVVCGSATRYVRGYPDQLPQLIELLPQIFTPVQIIAGRHDPIVPVTEAESLHAQLPNSRLNVLDTGHLVWEEAPERYGAIIAAWVNGGYLAGSAGMSLA
jgi:pimeloyl-ACP methyl ester carboxylesterase